MKALFLDRDGIVNIERGDYTWKVSDFTFTQHLVNFLKKARQLDFEIIVITNQGGINKGIYSAQDVELLHKWMIEALRKDDIEVLDVFYCPHHSDFQKCLCRKPGSLMLEKAIAIYGIDKNSSLMIGDRQRDVDAAENIGVKGVLQPSNPNWDEFDLGRYII